MEVVRDAPDTAASGPRTAARPWVCVWCGVCRPGLMSENLGLFTLSSIRRAAARDFLQVRLRHWTMGRDYLVFPLAKIVPLCDRWQATTYERGASPRADWYPTGLKPAVRELHEPAVLDLRSSCAGVGQAF